MDHIRLDLLQCSMNFLVPSGVVSVDNGINVLFAMSAIVLVCVTNYVYVVAILSQGADEFRAVGSDAAVSRRPACYHDYVHLPFLHGK